MKWTQQNDLELLKEITMRPLIQTRKFTKVRGKVWQDILTNLNKVFRNGTVSQKEVSERFRKLKNGNITNGTSGKKNCHLVLLVKNLQKRRLCWRIFYRELEAERERDSDSIRIEKKRKRESTCRKNEKTELWNNVLIFEREGKAKGKKAECSSNLGELVEFLSKSHDDQMEIRRKELGLGEKELNIQPKKIWKGCRTWW